ncbi:hypothetical protein E2C01_044952 [Portunus trituberculatus]|uniref:Uncharacterized protein n=1 Tax=Portunus trituberculatus TaxID=210409 RepID=A0A5B7G3Q8_PORTR|nr:hypothetical protein [Portunus trituberculatus]
MVCACEGSIKTLVSCIYFSTSVYFYTVGLFLISGFLIKWKSSEEDDDWLWCEW